MTTVPPQVIELPIAGGIDTKTDEKLVKAPSNLDIQNGVFTKHGSIVPRFGNDVLGERTVDEQTLFTPTRLAQRSGELVAVGATQLATYVPSSDDWVTRGNVNLWGVTPQALHDMPSGQTDPVSIESETIRVTAWEDTRGGAYYAIVDSATGQVLQSPSVLHSGASKLTAAATELGVLIVYLVAASNTLNATLFTRSSLGGVTTEYLLTDFATPYRFDFDYNLQAKAGLIFYETTDNTANTRGLEIDGAGRYVTEDNLGPTTVEDFDGFISVVAAGPGQDLDEGAFLVTWHRSALGGQIISNNYTKTSGFSATNAGFSDTTAVRATAVSRGDSYTSFQHTVVVFDDGSDLYTARYTEASSNFPQLLVRGCTLAGKPVRLSDVDGTADDDYLIPVQYTSGFQATTLLLDSDGIAQVRLAPGVTTNTARTNLPTWQRTSTGIAGPVSDKKRTIVDTTLEQAPDYTQAGVKLFSVETAPPDVQAVEYRDSLYVAGGALWHYDGASVVETGFWFYPELDLTQFGAAVTNQPFSRTMAGTANTGSNTYRYWVVYEWYDATGRRSQSTAIPFLLTNMVDPGVTALSLSVPPLQFSRKTDVRIAVYRTHPDNSSGIAYRVSSNVGTAAQNDTNADVTITDNTSDSVLQAGENFYLSRGLIDNTAPGLVSQLATFDDRIVYVSPEDKTKVFFSNRPADFDQPTFNEGFRLQVPRDGGVVTALADIDQKLVMFKANRVYAVTGAGPSNTGLGEYGVPEKVQGDTGCTQRNSVARWHSGIVFQSDKGIRALDRQLNLLPIGDPVELYENVPVTSTSLLADEAALVFLTADDRTLYYDYERNAWSTWVNHAGLSSAVIGADYYWLRSDGAVLKRNTSSYQDDGSPVGLKIRTAWYNPGSIQKLWYCWRAMFLGNYLSDHDINIKVYINYRDYAEYTTTWDPSTGLNTGTWGGAGTWGGGAAFGIPDASKQDGVYQFSHAPHTVKVQSISFEISATLPNNPGGGFEMTSIAVLVGVLDGVFNIPGNKQV